MRTSPHSTSRTHSTSRKGGALIAVMWVAAALSAIALSVSLTVRGETERTSTLTDGVRAYYLATGAIERLLLYIQWGPVPGPDGKPRFEPGTPRVMMNFPSGIAVVDVIGENSKLNASTIKPEELMRLLMLLGTDMERARMLTMAIVDWRTPAPAGVTMFDQFYMALTPSFRSRHASFQEIEEILLVKGMTPELFYGTLVRDPQAGLVPRAGLRDCLSVYGSDGAVDINHAQPAVLAAIGIPPHVVTMIEQRRRVSPFRTAADLGAMAQMAGPAGARLTMGGQTIFTFRATGRLRRPDGTFSDLTRSVSAMLKFHQRPVNAPPIEFLRWYDN